VMNLEVTIGDAGGTRRGALAAVSDEGPLLFRLQEEPGFTSWDSTRIICVRKQTAAGTGGRSAETGPDEPSDDSPGGEALGSRSPLDPHPAGSVPAFAESGPPRRG